MNKCWTCGALLPDSAVRACTRKPCDAGNVLARSPQPVRQPVANPVYIAGVPLYDTTIKIRGGVDVEVGNVVGDRYIDPP